MFLSRRVCARFRRKSSEAVFYRVARNGVGRVSVIGKHLIGIFVFAVRFFERVSVGAEREGVIAFFYLVAHKAVVVFVVAIVGR